MEYLEYERRQYNSDVISHSFVGLPTHERRNAWDRLWKSKSSTTPCLLKEKFLTQAIENQSRSYQFPT